MPVQTNIEERQEGRQQMNRQTNDIMILQTEKKELKIQIQTGKTEMKKTQKIHVRTDRNKQNERDSKDKRKKEKADRCKDRQK